MGQVPPDGDPYPQPAGPNLKELDELQLILSAPEKKKHFEVLKQEVVMAREIQEDIKEEQQTKRTTITRITIVKDADLPIDAAVLRALRQYRNPKPLVHDITVAFLMLLGEYEFDTRVRISS